MVNEGVFQKQEERKHKLKDLSGRYAYEALLRLASDLKIDAESLLRIMAGLQGITPALGKRIDYLWQIKFGKVTVEVPKPALEIEAIPQSSAYYYLDSLFGRRYLYLDPVYWDLLTEYVSEEEYDGALTRVRNKINAEIDVFFEGELSVVPTEKISVATLQGAEIPQTRVFEFNIIDRDTKEPRYALKYYNGDVQIYYGNLPVDKIVAILRKEGAWE